MDYSEGLLLTPADNAILRDLVGWWQNLQYNPPKAHAPPVLAQAPDVYLARTAAGIPAMVAEAGTGTDSSVGIISKAECKLYRIDDRGSAGADVDPIGVTRDVYNPGLTAVPPNVLFLAVKTKDGKFNVAAVGGAGDQVEVCEPANDGATPPKPKLMSWVKDRYDLPSDTVAPTGAKVWMRDANSPQP